MEECAWLETDLSGQVSKGRFQVTSSMRFGPAGFARPHSRTKAEPATFFPTAEPLVSCRSRLPWMSGGTSPQSASRLGTACRPIS